jgi:hypothetical protein
VVTSDETEVSKRRFYEAALTAAEQAEVRGAMEVQGLDEELAALRVRLRSAIHDKPEDLALMLRGMDVLRRMVAVKYGLTRGDSEALSAFAEETLRRLRERGGDGAGPDA